MSVTQKNTYVIGSNNDLTNAALLNIDLNRIGGDLTYLENDGGTLKVSVGSLIEANGSIYAVSGSAETPSGTAEDGAYLFFDPSSESFVWSTTAGTYDAALGGIYDASDRRQCRFKLNSDTTWNQIVATAGDSRPLLGIEDSASNVGNVGWFVSSSVPRRILCDGSTISKTTNPEYVELVDMLKAEAGADTGHPFYHADSDKAKIPNLTSRFIRAMGSGRKAGQFQADAFQSHTHTAPVSGGGTQSNRFSSEGSATVQNETATTNASGSADETRPDNVTLYPLIGY